MHTHRASLTRAERIAIAVIGRAVLVLLGLVVVVLGLLFAAVGSSPATVLAVALALGVGAACLREARHPGIH